MRRRDFIRLLGGTAAAWPLAARAQQPARLPLVGLISPLTQAAAVRNVEQFRKGLRDLGYVEGRSVALELRFADGRPERLPEVAAALVTLKPDVILVGSSAGILAAHQVTQAIPLVMITLENPITLGLIKSIARPGTNITGTWLAGDEALVGKRLAMLKDLAPGTARVGAFLNPGDATDAPMFRLLPAAAGALGLDLGVFEVRDASEIQAAFSSAGRAGVQALFVSPTPLFLSNCQEIATTAARLRLPAVYGWREFAEAGGLASYGPNLPDIYRRSAGVVDKILKGANPADLPIEIPTRFDLVVNLKAAKTIGLTISDRFLLLADEVIE
jgi:putative tryptophan/tyrosine transport system substrate-binding protein